MRIKLLTRFAHTFYYNVQIFCKDSPLVTTLLITNLQRVGCFVFRFSSQKKFVISFPKMVVAYLESFIITIYQFRKPYYILITQTLISFTRLKAIIKGNYRIQISFVVILFSYLDTVFVWWRMILLTMCSAKNDAAKSIF